MEDGAEVPLVETYSLDNGVDASQFNSLEELTKYLVEQEEKKKKPAGRLPSSSQMCAERGHGEGEVPLVEAYSLDNGVDASQLSILEELTKYLVEQEEKNKKLAGGLSSFSQMCAEQGYGEGEVPRVEAYSLDDGVDRSQFKSQEELVKYLIAQEEKKKKSARRLPSSGRAERGYGEGEVPRVEAHSLDNGVDANQLRILEELTKYLAEQEDKNKKPAGRLPSFSQMCAERGYGEGEVPRAEAYSLDDGVDRSQFKSQEDLVKYLIAQEEKKKKR